MRVRPGWNSIRIGCALVAVSLLGFVWASIGWLIACAALAWGVCVVLEYRALARRIRQVELSGTLPGVVGRDTAFPVTTEVAAKGSGRFRGEFRLVYPDQVDPGIEMHTFDLDGSKSSTAFESTLNIATRGRYGFGGFYLRLKGGLNLLEGTIAVDHESIVKVMPEGYVSKDTLNPNTLSESVLMAKVIRTRLSGVGSEFESLSEYREGDDPRRIDWRTTARTRYPIVRRYQVERHRDVMILIDCGRLMGSETERGSKLDCAVDSALMLARVALYNGDRCGMGMFDSEVLGYLPPVTGLRSLNAIADCVYDLDTRWRETDFGLMYETLRARRQKRSLLVIISDLIDVQTSIRATRSLAALGKQHVLLFAALRTPLLRRITHEPIESMVDGSRHAVAHRLSQDRAEALVTLNQSGVHVLDVEPTELTVPLVNQFIELRERNIL